MLRQLTLSSLFALNLVWASTSLQAQERSYINPGIPDEPTSAPFSSAVRVGDTLYVSGMLGLENGQVPGDPAQEARNMLDSVKATLADAGMTMDDLVQVTIYCSDLDLYGVFNEVYRTYFENDMPARAFIGAGSLLRGARFEMQSLAVAR